MSHDVDLNMLDRLVDTLSYEELPSAFNRNVLRRLIDMARYQSGSTKAVVAFDTLAAWKDANTQRKITGPMSVNSAVPGASYTWLTIARDEAGATVAGTGHYPMDSIVDLVTKMGLL